MTGIPITAAAGRSSRSPAVPAGTSRTPGHTRGLAGPTPCLPWPRWPRLRMIPGRRTPSGRERFPGPMRPAGGWPGACRRWRSELPCPVPQPIGCRCCRGWRQSPRLPAREGPTPGRRCGHPTSRRGLPPLRIARRSTRPCVRQSPPRPARASPTPGRRCGHPTSRRGVPPLRIARRSTRPCVR